MVQFAHGKLDKQDYAIKFFLSKKGFAAEEALYRHTTLGQLLPQVRRLFSNYSPNKYTQQFPQMLRSLFGY